MFPLPATITVMIMVVVTIGLIVWDIVVATNKIPNSIDTISGRMKAWGKTTILLPWLWAILYGHFWGPIKLGQLMPSKTGIALLVFLTWCVLLTGVAMRQHNIAVTSSWLVFFLVLNVGAIAGAFLWPQ